MLSAEPHVLFVLNPPYSGSTALAHLLNTAPGTMMLRHNGEGARLLPLGKNPLRWDPALRVSWRRVRAVWMRRIQEHSDMHGPPSLIIEKSPPNMMRLEGLMRTFPRHSLLAFNRDPFAFCASVVHRVTKHPSQRLASLEKGINHWLLTSSQLCQHIETLGVPFFTYESLCATPHSIAAALGRWRPELEGIDVTRPLSIKDYPPQPLANHNARQIATLSADEIELIARCMAPHVDLVRFFGYTLTHPGEVVAAGLQLPPPPTAAAHARRT